jgi:hypothetical protein
VRLEGGHDGVDAVAHCTARKDRHRAWVMALAEGLAVVVAERLHVGPLRQLELFSAPACPPLCGAPGVAGVGRRCGRHPREREENTNRHRHCEMPFPVLHVSLLVLVHVSLLVLVFLFVLNC